MIKDLLISKKYFTVPFVLWLIFGMAALFIMSKGDLVLFFNANRNPISNFYSVVASNFAEYGFILLFLAFLLNKSFGNAFIAAFTWSASGIGVQLLKRVFSEPRPAAFFKEKILNFVGDGKLHYANSFPSGHSTTAFALFFVFALFTDSKKWQFLFFILALSTALSRVYLLQHFFIDVYFGSILGFVISILVFVSINSSNIFGFQTWKNKKLGHKRLF